MKPCRSAMPVLLRGYGEGCGNYLTSQKRPNSYIRRTAPNFHHSYPRISTDNMDVTDCVSSRGSMELLKPPPIQVYSLHLWGAEIGVHCTPTVPPLYPHCTPIVPHCTLTVPHSISFNERRRRKSRRKEEEEN